MDNRHVIASSLTDNELARAFSELVAERWDSWNLTPFLLYLVDSCAPSALPYLAEQFDVKGLQGFAVAVTEQQQRDLIKRSIALHKYIGTPWAIREACRTVGFPVVILEEGVPETPGGEAGPDDWARFRVLLEADFNRHITAEEARKLRGFVEYYKNARSHLVELGFFQYYKDNNIIITETVQTTSLALYPHIITLDPDGAKKSVAITCSDAWVLKQTLYEWGDGTTDKITLELPSPETIVVSSNINNHRDRTLEIPILSPNNIKLGTLTVRQELEWHNGYSDAYSDAY